MTLLLVHNTVDLYGASRSLLRLSSGLIASGHEVNVVLPGRGELSEALGKAGARVFSHPWLWHVDRQCLKGPVAAAMFALKATPSVAVMGWYALKCRADLIHSNTALILSPAIAAWLLRLPHVWHIREFFCEFGPLWKYYQRMMCGLSKTVIAVSAAVRDQFAPELRGCVKVIHNGFPAEEFEGVTEECVRSFVDAHGLGAGLRVGIMGRIKWKRKGQEVFVRAAGRLKTRHPDVQFVVIGSPYPGNEDHLERLLGLAKELRLDGSFRYTGDVRDIKAAYAAMDVIVLASTQPEPFGGVVIEAMAMGKPVVGTAVGGTVEQIVDGSSGFLFAPGDDAELAEKLDCLLSSEASRQSMGQAGRTRYEDHFKFEQFFQQLLRVYSEARG